MIGYAFQEYSGLSFANGKVRRLRVAGDWRLETEDSEQQPVCIIRRNKHLRVEILRR